MAVPSHHFVCIILSKIYYTYYTYLSQDEYYIIDEFQFQVFVFTETTDKLQGTFKGTTTTGQAEGQGNLCI